jgi:rhodanese-related sulfurtransferase
MREIHPDDLDEMIENHDAPLIVDTRTADEFTRDHIPGALHIPEGGMQNAVDPYGEQRETTLTRADTRAIVLYSNHGVRSAAAAAELDRLGFANVYTLAGGIELWRQAGMAVVRG